MILAARMMPSEPSIDGSASAGPNLGNAMRRLFMLLSLPTLLLLPPAPATAGPNAPLCFAIEKNYADCLAREGVKLRRWRRYHDWDDDPWDRRPPPSPEQACANWLVPLQANHCF